MPAPATALYGFTAKATPAAGDYLHLASTADGGADRKVLVSALFTSPALTTPSLGAATATSLAASGAVTAATFNKLTLTTPASGATLTIADGKTLTVNNTITLAGTDGTTITLPSTSATMARTDAAQTFTGTQTFSGTIAGAAITGTTLGLTSASTILNATAIPAGGTTGSGYKFSSTSNFGVFFGSGEPTLSAAQGSIYLRSDGSSTSTRAYINTDGSTTWTAVTTAA